MADEDLKNPHVRALRDLALSYPESQESFPWGHRVIKVREKSFVFFGGEEGSIGISVKLPQSAEAALSLPFTEPTGYGLGKSGWVSARFPAGEDLPVPILAAWIDESYRAIAPKTLVARLGGGAAPKPVAAAKRASPKKAATPAAKKAEASAPKGAATRTEETAEATAPRRAAKPATAKKSETSAPKRAATPAAKKAETSAPKRAATAAAKKAEASAPRRAPAVKATGIKRSHSGSKRSAS